VGLGKHRSAEHGLVQFGMQLIARISDPGGVRWHRGRQWMCRLERPLMTSCRKVMGTVGRWGFSLVFSGFSLSRCKRMARDARKACLRVAIGGSGDSRNTAMRGRNVPTIFVTRAFSRCNVATSDAKRTIGG